ncbi:MAG: sigma-70 family RNA polymerase sigma factor [Prevotella sp.]|jgi:RNA polymerase sigma-70 factor (ECF subfamily)|nr:sigma-70 family RNA polymerase sigma factor [Prevotella sp.]
MTKDETIYRIIKSDREGGFRILLDTYQKPVYYFIRRMVVVHEDAQDVMQETFVKIFLGLNGFRGDSALSTWIYRIATNESLRFLNKKGIKLVSADNVHDELIDSLRASDYIDYEDKMAVKFQEVILHLSDKQRVIFNLRYYDEMDYDQISKITDTKVATLKVTYHYIKEKIKKQMVEE